MSNFIQWNGIAEDGNNGDFTWGGNPYTWGDIQLISQIVSGGFSRKSRVQREEWLQEWKKEQPVEKQKQLVELICRVKGEQVYGDEIELDEIEIKVEDVEMVIGEALKDNFVSLVCEIGDEKIKMKTKES